MMIYSIVNDNCTQSYEIGSHDIERILSCNLSLKMYSSLNSLFPKIDRDINFPSHFLCIAMQTGNSNLKSSD